ncbi:nitrilase-related carbon-nitrogen hydrolase [Mycoplasma sp. P36-A1]|uniref:nitrilase-related carbon-nitrogen hydrolase n=1 Tax=Mycoplasma sp. P36-A1 TaxID=3252900 RepID=UPI003C2E99E1
MAKEKKELRVGIVQATPYLFDVNKTVDKAIKLISKASKNNVELLVFPQSFIPCYPYAINIGSEFGLSTNYGQDNKLKFYKNSISLGDANMSKLLNKCKENNINISIGISEYDYENNQLYNTNLLIDKKGEIILNSKNNNLVGLESILWQESKEQQQYTAKLDQCNVGILNNFENYNPLARSYMYLNNIEIYCAPNSNDSLEWQEAIQFIAKESKSFVLSACQYSYIEDKEDKLTLSSISNKKILRGGSAIIDPKGNYIIGPIYDKEALLIANISLEEVIEARLDINPKDMINKVI